MDSDDRNEILQKLEDAKTEEMERLEEFQEQMDKIEELEDLLQKIEELEETTDSENE